jgi:phasin family protein
MAHQSQSLIDMLMQLGRTLPIPNLDVERIVAHHRRNLEALEQSARTSSDGASAMFNRQREMLQDAISDATRSARDFQTPTSPQDLVANQVDFARRAFERAVENASELAGMAQRSSSGSADILRDRFRAALGEMQDGLRKPEE